VYDGYQLSGDMILQKSELFFSVMMPGFSFCPTHEASSDGAIHSVSWRRNIVRLFGFIHQSLVSSFWWL
jgi:hypothetical protein